MWSVFSEVARRMKQSINDLRGGILSVIAHHVEHPFPRLTVVRTPRKDKARYFGPYASAGSVSPSTLS